MSRPPAELLLEVDCSFLGKNTLIYPQILFIYSILSTGKADQTLVDTVSVGVHEGGRLIRYVTILRFLFAILWDRCTSLSVVECIAIEIHMIEEVVNKSAIGDVALRRLLDKTFTSTIVPFIVGFGPASGSLSLQSIHFISPHALRLITLLADAMVAAKDLPVYSQWLNDLSQWFLTLVCNAVRVLRSPLHPQHTSRMLSSCLSSLR